MPDQRPSTSQPGQSELPRYTHAGCRTVVVLSGLMTLMTVLSACNPLLDRPPRWGNPAVNTRFASLGPTDLSEVRVASDRCGADTKNIARQHWTNFLRLMAALPPANSIGRVGPWTDHLVISVETSRGSYLVALSTRAELNGQIVAIVKGGRQPDEFLSFHDGGLLWEWLSTTPDLFSQLESQ